MKLSNHKLPTNPNVVKAFAVITFITIFFPVWFDSIPLEGVTETTKEMVHWFVKGIDLLAGIVAIFTNTEYDSTNYNTKNLK